MEKDTLKKTEQKKSKKSSNKEDILNSKAKNKNYYNYTDRVFFLSLVILLVLSIGDIFLNNSFDFNEEKNIKYTDKGNINYKVYLKDNDFYDNDYLNKDMVYVSTLINKIDIDYKYLFDIEEKESINFDYDIYGKLEIKDSDGKNTFYEKVYPITSSKKVYKDNIDKYILEERVSIDYPKYNSIANKFRQNYGIDTTSNFVVYLNVHKKGASDEIHKLDEYSQMFATIPLAKQSININLNTNQMNKTGYIKSVPIFKASNYYLLAVAIVCFIIFILLLIKLIKFLIKIFKLSPKYDRYVKKILKEYDRLIVETTSAPDFSNMKKINVKSFTELLDVRDNLGFPIKYYVVTKHQECNFYITHMNEVYLLIIKSIDFEK